MWSSWRETDVGRQHFLNCYLNHNNGTHSLHWAVFQRPAKNSCVGSGLVGVVVPRNCHMSWFFFWKLERAAVAEKGVLSFIPLKSNQRARWCFCWWGNGGCNSISVQCLLCHWQEPKEQACDLPGSPLGLEYSFFEFLILKLAFRMCEGS